MKETEVIAPILDYAETVKDIQIISVHVSMKIASGLKGRAKNASLSR